MAAPYTWTAPADWPTDLIVTETELNQQVRDNLKALGPGPFLRGRINANATIAAGIGFTVSHTSTGIYAVTFATALPTLPEVTLSVGQASTDVAGGRFWWATILTGSVSVNGFTALIGSCGNGSGGFSVQNADAIWSFIAMPAQS